jgi:phage protein D
VGLIDLAFRISIDGLDITERLRPILVDLTVTDKAGTVSDTASILLADPGGRIVMPRRGAKVAIDLPLGVGLVPVFAGGVDDVRSKYDRGTGLQMQIAAKGMDTRGALKAPREQHWDDADLKTVLREAGEAAGVTVKVHESLGSIRRAWWGMDGESLVAFGRRIARETGATFKFTGGSEAVLAPRSSGLSAGGKALPSILVRPGDNLLSLDLAPEHGRPRFGKIRARWYDLKEGRLRTETVETEDEDGGEQTLPETAADEEAAGHAAGSEKAEAERAKGGGRVEITGDPRATPEGSALLSGVRPGIDGSYTIETVTHSLSRGRGFVTALDLVKPGDGVGKDDR